MNVYYDLCVLLWKFHRKLSRLSGSEPCLTATSGIVVYYYYFYFFYRLLVKGAGRVFRLASNFRSLSSLVTNMAPASRAVAVVALSLLYLSGEIVSTEYFSTLTLFNNELHKQGCSSLSEWEDYAADCGKSLFFLLSLCLVLLGATVTAAPGG